MKLHFAGAESKSWDQLRINCGVRKFLQSYFYLKKHKPLTSMDLLIDSGGFTARTKGVEISVEKYANFLNENKIKFAFNLDTNNFKETDDNHKFLIKYCPFTYIIPIYHLSDYLNQKDYIYELLNYPYIGIGGIVGSSLSKELKKKFYDFTFSKTLDKIKVHGLGITGYKDMSNYPFFSVDSTSWLVSARYGGSMVEEDEKFIYFLNKTQDAYTRSKKEIFYFLNLEKEITNLWTLRGVKWN